MPFVLGLLFVLSRKKIRLGFLFNFGKFTGVEHCELESIRAVNLSNGVKILRPGNNSTSVCLIDSLMEEDMMKQIVVNMDSNYCELLRYKMETYVQLPCNAIKTLSRIALGMVGGGTHILIT